MSQETNAHSSGVVQVRMPQANVNDEAVTLVNWRVADGGQVAEGQPLCEVETSKAVGEVSSPASGVVKHAAAVGDVIAVGQVFAYIGPSPEAIDSCRSVRPSPVAHQTSTDDRGSVVATAGAIDLAGRYGIDLSMIPAAGKISRADVERFIAEQGLPQRDMVEPAAGANQGLPAALAKLVADQGELSDHHWAIARHLQRTQSQIVAAHVMMDVSMSGANRWIEAKRWAGLVTGTLPILLHAAAAAIAGQTKLASFRLGRHVYRYRSVDIAYTARSGDGRLFTPVVRSVDRLSLDEIAAECGRLNMAVFRGQLSAEQMTGGCMTVSVLSDRPVRFHIGLQNAYQSALLTAGAVRDELALIDGQPTAVPIMTLALSYDHGLMDGWEAAEALAAARTAIQQINV